MPTFETPTVRPPRARDRYERKFGGGTPDPRSPMIGGGGEPAGGIPDRYREMIDRNFPRGGGRGQTFGPFRGGDPDAFTPEGMGPDGGGGGFPGPSGQGNTGGGVEFEKDFGDGGGGGGGEGGGGEGTEGDEPWMPPTSPPPRAELPSVPGDVEIPDAPDFQALAELPEAQRLREYTTPEGAFQGEGMYDPLQSLFGDMASTAREWADTPSRYDQGLVQEGLDIVRDQLDEQREEALANLDERLTQRGIVGSSVDADHTRELEEDLARQLRDFGFDLSREQARTVAQDRAQAMNALRGAGQFGLGVGDFGRGLGRDRRQEEQFEWQTDRQRARDLEDDRRTRAQLGLRGAGMQWDADMGSAQFENQMMEQRFSDAMQRAGLGEEQRQFDAGYGLDRGRLGLARDQFGFNQERWAQEFGLSQDQFEFDKRMRQRAMELREEGMDADEAYRQAQLELERERLQQGDTQFLAQLLQGVNWDKIDDDTKEALQKALQDATGG